MNNTVGVEWLTCVDSYIRILTTIVKIHDRKLPGRRSLAIAQTSYGMSNQTYILKGSEVLILPS